jgi:potassium-dependent mechanosensitive channel
MKTFNHLILILLLFMTQLIVAQKDQTTGSKSTLPSINTVEDYLNLLKENNKSSSADNTVVMRQNKILQKLREKTDMGKSVLREGFDSLIIQKELEGSVEWNELASKGIFENDVKFIMTSNLWVSTIIFRELLTRTEISLGKLILYRNKFEKVQLGIDSLISLDVLYQTPKDSSASLAYLARMMKAQAEASTVTNQTNIILNKIQELESLASILKFDLEAKLLKTDQLHKQQIYTNTEQDFKNFTNYRGTYKSFGEVLSYSSTKIFLAMLFYLVNHIGLTIFMVLVLALMFFYLKALKKHLSLIVNENSILDYYALNYPFLTSIVIISNVFQFFYGNPPFVFYAGFWLMTYGILIHLLKNRLDIFWKRWFFILGVLYLIVYLDNMLLLAHPLDKILVFILSIFGIGLGMFALFNLKKSPNKVRFLKWFLVLFVIFEMLALFLNVSGYHNTSKRAMIAGFMGLVLIILTVWTVKILYKVFRLSLEVYKKTDDNNFAINLDRFNKKMSSGFFVLAFVGWAYMFVHFFYVLQIIIEPIVEFFTKERQLGNIVFTFDSILLFIAIIFISTAISKILSYLLADSYVIKKSAKNKTGPELGSWVLVLRITIISLGLLIAFASAGIALDRITIIISALSVGIGFGMQTLINNLVSGIIIAFEKPISVGDVVEVAGKTGKMKSIGFRSSMITTWDGSDVVIPNGDLLNQHLVNWTLGNSKARFEIIVGVAYGTNLEEVHQLVMDLMNSHNDILKYPPPFIVFKEFAKSSIDMSIRFWVAEYSTGITVKSDLIIAIDKLFKENNIVIPFPQQDVYVKSLAGKDEQKLL